jgi:indole-3-glycerol phosphate synthase
MEQKTQSFLTDILASTREAVLSAKRRRPVKEIKQQARDAEPPRDFGDSVSALAGLKLIAEIKKASPSQGVLRRDFNPVDIARRYEEHGASALSVLTEERFFLGRLSYLEEVRKNVGLPLLRKDFIIDEYQVHEARAFGADAVLLIAAILEDARLKDYGDLASDLGMASLIEVHTPEERDRALTTGGRLIGINNRDLNTFKTDLDTTFKLLEEIPDDCVVVSESGVATRKDIERLREAGLDAVLIGETFMKAPDIGDKIRELFG